MRWLKTAAPRSIRDRWVVSALPLARFNPADAQALTRWVTFQVPDLVVEIGSGGTVHRDDVRVETLPAAATMPALRRLLATADARSAVHESMSDRIRREPLAMARVLAARYPETPAISYIPAVAWVNTLRLAAITGGRVAARQGCRTDETVDVRGEEAVRRSHPIDRGGRYHRLR